MERFSQRENVLLGYSPQRASGNYSSSPKTPFRHQDVDFHDVFGGPPRRSSMQEMRYSLNETTNSSNNTNPGEEDTDLPRRPWSGLNEMPVFGEETLTRRQYPSDDFFNDIFRGDDSLNSHKRSDRDPFGSTPGSRVLSPARPLPPRADPFGSSLPAQFQLSLPARSTKAMDSPTFPSGNQSLYKYNDPASNGISCLYTPSSPLSRLSSEAFKKEDESRNEIRPSYRPSPLSHKFSLSSKEPSYMTKSDELESTDIGSNLKKDLKGTEAPSNSSQFHFSIYKWASKEVPLLMPLRLGNSSKSKEKVKTERCSSSNGRMESDNMAGGLQTSIWCDSDVHFLNHSISANNESPNTEGRKQDKTSLLKTGSEDRVEPYHIIEEAVLSVSGSNFINNVPNIVETVPADAISSDKREEIKPHSPFEVGLCGSTEKGLAMIMQAAQKHELKPLRSLLHEPNEGQGNDEIIRKSEAKDGMVKKTHSKSDVRKMVKKRDEKIISSNKAEVSQVSEPLSQGSSRTLRDSLGRNRVKGKVKEFIKIFNQEATSKAEIEIETGSQSCQWKSTGTCGADKEGSPNITQTNEKNHIHNVNKMKTPPNASVMVDKNLAESAKQKSHGKNRDFSENKNSFGQKDATETSSESLPDGAKVTVGDMDDLFQENFMVKELPNEQHQLPQIGEGSEDIQASDAKIRKWSNGKKGNIRSLLSTLQYVLWPGSGWKPVPLVDIIEGSAVKRSYQKALLCLHPDKLQQKGAAPHQKYIADKVFVILQEAWDHFNSIGAI